MVNEKIFIAIPSFQEEDLLNTIKSIYSEAEKPENVYVGICNQRLDGNFEDFSSFPNVRTANLVLPNSLGLGMAWLIATWLMLELAQNWHQFVWLPTLEKLTVSNP